MNTPVALERLGSEPAAPTSSTSTAQSSPASNSAKTTLLDLLSCPTSGMAGPTETPSDPSAPPLPPLPQILDAPTPEELSAAVAGRTSFSERTPGLQLVWDATSLSTFLACPTRYYYSIILGLTPQHKSVHLTFGGAYQRALETYDRERLRGASHRDSMITAVAVGYREGASLPLDKRPDNLPVTEPTPPPEVKRRDQLVRAIVDHCEQFADDPLRTVALADGSPAVELSFRFDAGFDLGWPPEPVEFAGHLDRVVDGGADGTPWSILDHKTTKGAINDQYRMKMELSTQMLHYAFGGAVVLPQKPDNIVIDVVQMLTDNVRTTRFPIRYTQAQRTEYYQDIVQQLPAVERYLQDGKFPRNRESCMLCDFKRVCRVDPSIRPHIAATEFGRRFWDPAKPRTEEGAR